MTALRLLRHAGQSALAREFEAPGAESQRYAAALDTLVGVWLDVSLAAYTFLTAVRGAQTWLDESLVT